MATLRTYSFETTYRVFTCWIIHDSIHVAQFQYFMPFKTLQVPRYVFLNMGISTLVEYNYEICLFIKRLSQFLADGTLEKLSSKSGREVDLDISSDNGLFESDIYS